MNGNRVGYGTGGYDRFMENQQLSRKICLVFEGQIVEDIEAEEHDVAMDIIITENRLIELN